MKNFIVNCNATGEFNPVEHTSLYRHADGTSNLYLPAEPAMMWFRTVHPAGRLEQVIVRIEEFKYATMEGRVYDENGVLLANAFATRYFKDDTYGRDYIQNAGTCAIRKALGNCGFGTPLNAEYVEGMTRVIDETVQGVTAEDFVDAGTKVSNIPMPPIPVAQPVEVEKPRRKAKDVATEPISVPAAQPVVSVAQPVVPDAVSVAPVAAPVPTFNPQPVAPVMKEEEYTEQTLGAIAGEPEEEPVKVPIVETAGYQFTHDEAMEYMLEVGRYKGVTLGDLVNEGRLDELKKFRSPTFITKPVYAAASLLCDEMGL